MAIAALVLLIASVNLANLLLARAIARQQEFSVRLAIGGSRTRVLQQVLVESIVLAALGSAAALAVTFTVSRSIVPLISTTVDRDLSRSVDRLADVRLHGARRRATAAAIAGFAPALRAARATAFRPGERGTTAPRGALAGRRVLVSLQVAVTLVLLFGALLFLRSFRNLATQDLGVQQDGVVIANVFFPPSGFPEEKRVLAYRGSGGPVARPAGCDRARRGPHDSDGRQLQRSRHQSRRREQGQSNIGTSSARATFKVLGTPLIAGRDFDDRDVPGAPLVAIVNESFAQRILGGGDVLGRRIADHQRRERAGHGLRNHRRRQEPEIQRHPRIVPADPLHRVVADCRPALDAPLRGPFHRDGRSGDRCYRGHVERHRSEDHGALLAAVHASVRSAAAGAADGAARRSSSASSRCRWRSSACTVSSRTRWRPGGPRSACAWRWAPRGRGILAMILGDVGRMMVVGVAAGSALALLASRAVGSLLFGLEPTDLATLAIAGASLLADRPHRRTAARQAGGRDRSTDRLARTVTATDYHRLGTD